MISSELLDILACPACIKEKTPAASGKRQGELEVVEDGKGLKCFTCGLVYPVTDGIPVMLIGEAKRSES